jgi:TIR domain
VVNATPGPAGKMSTGTHLEIPSHNAVGRGRAVFISYAQADALWLDRLLLNLKPLAFEELISVATDRDIGLGDDWHARIQADLNRAGAAVLLVSPAFLASEYIRNNDTENGHKVI